MLKQPILKVRKKDGSYLETMVESTENLRLPTQLNSS